MAPSNGVHYVVAAKTESDATRSHAGSDYDDVTDSLHFLVCYFSSRFSDVLDLEQRSLNFATMGHYAPNGRKGVD